MADCEEALQNSELGRRYFSEAGSARRSLQGSLERGEDLVALDESGQCLGFIWTQPKGTFSVFPYLHIIAVKEECRGKGVGKKLMEASENEMFKEHRKIFLVVGDFNPAAKRLYERLGYVEVGPIPDLYRKGITEYLMVKSRPDEWVSA